MSDKVLEIRYSISIHGKKLSDDRMDCITDIEINNNCDGSDTMTISVSDPDYKFISDDIFIEDVRVHARINWVGSTHHEDFEGYISAIDLSFPTEGFPSLTINCVDNTHRMNRKKKNRSWTNVTNADVVRKIAKEYGLKCVIQKGYTFKKKDTITQSDKTDIEMLESLASEELYPFMCKVRGTTLYYVKRGLLDDPKVKLGYRTYPFNLLSFSPKIIKETKKEEIASSSVTPSTKKVDKSKSNPSTTKTETQGDQVKTTSKATTDAGYSYTSTDGWIQNKVGEVIDNNKETIISKAKGGK